MSQVAQLQTDLRVRRAAQRELLAVVEELRREQALADRYRGKHARAYWQASRGRFLEALDLLEMSLADLEVHDQHALDNLRDAMERSLRALRAHREQFARVQWLVKAPRDLTRRMVERGLAREWQGAHIRKPRYEQDANVQNPGKGRGFNMRACLA